MGYGISRRFDAWTKVETISLISSGLFLSGSMLVPLANLKGSDKDSESKAGVQGPSFCFGRSAREQEKLSEAIGRFSRLLRDRTKSEGLVDPKW